MVNHYSIVNKCLGKGMSMPRMGGRSIVKDRKSKNYDNPLDAFDTNKNSRLKKNKSDPSQDIIDKMIKRSESYKYDDEDDD